MQPFNEALSLMVVGMITVIFILFSIVLIGDILIRVSNKYLPEEAQESKAEKPHRTSNNTHAAIKAAISLATKGKGTVTSITKI